MNQDVFNLEVDESEFVEVLQEFAKSIGRKRVSNVKGDATLWLDADGLHIELHGNEHWISAKGEWSRPVIVAASFIVGLGKVPPRGPVIRISVESDRMKIGTSSHGCSFVVGPK